MKNKIKIKRFMTQKRVSIFMSLLFLSPWIIGFLIFSLYPFIQMVLFAFSNVIFRPNKTIYAPVGWRNFSEILFIDPDFRLSLLEHLHYVVILLPMVMVLAIILATLLNKIEVGKGFFRSVYFLPVILISGPLLGDLFSIEAFTLTGLHEFFVFDYFAKVLPPTLKVIFFFIIDNIILCLWFGGVQLLIFLSGMKRIDGSLYEAAEIEGASSWQVFWKITMPILKPFIIINAIYTLVDLSTTFSPISDLILTSMEQENRGYGYAAAVSWLYLLVQLIFLAIILFLLAKDHRDARKRRELRRERRIVRIRKSVL